MVVTGPDGPVPPGLSALPGPGEFAASPALAELIAATPADQRPWLRLIVFLSGRNSSRQPGRRW
jgi:hypothetical protein